MARFFPTIGLRFGCEFARVGFRFSFRVLCWQMSRLTRLTLVMLGEHRTRLHRLRLNWHILFYSDTGLYVIHKLQMLVRVCLNPLCFPANAIPDDVERRGRRERS